MTSALGGRVADPQQAEGAVGGRVGQVKLQLLEVDTQEQIQHQAAQNLLGGQALPPDVAAHARGHQVVQDLRLQRGKRVENLGDGGQRARVLVRNLAKGQSGLQRVSGAHLECIADGTPDAAEEQSDLSDNPICGLVWEAQATRWTLSPRRG